MLLAAGRLRGPALALVLRDRALAVPRCSVWRSGLVGASFSVGTPYVARFFPKEQPRLRDGLFRRRHASARRSTCSSRRR